MRQGKFLVLLMVMIMSNRNVGGKGYIWYTNNGIRGYPGYNISPQYPNENLPVSLDPDTYERYSPIHNIYTRYRDDVNGDYITGEYVMRIIREKSIGEEAPHLLTRTVIIN